MKKWKDCPKKVRKFYCLYKIFKIMKLTTLLLTITALQVFASGSYSQGTKLTLDLGETTVEQVLMEIESQSEFYFLFNDKLVDIDRKVNLTMADQKVEEVLVLLFGNTKIDFIVMDRQIILSPAEYLYEAKLKLQPQLITGMVLDENGEPLPGANVTMKGTTQGAVTNLEGQFTLEVDDPSTVLVFSFVGYATTEVTVGNQTEISVNLQLDILGLDEVVVIGYGTQKKTEITGAVGSLDADILQERPQTNLVQALQGNLAGMTIKLDYCQ
jgi:hypothetical protein